MHRSKLPLTTWFWAAHLTASAVAIHRPKKFDGGEEARAEPATLPQGLSAS